jgi:hypothetical protein
VYPSTDSAASWNPVNTGIDAAVLSFAADPTNTAIVYAASHGGSVFK